MWQESREAREKDRRQPARVPWARAGPTGARLEQTLMDMSDE